MNTPYFNDLNYSLANEDNFLELEIAKLHSVEKVVTVCGSGARALSLLAVNPSELHVVDLASQQIDLFSLKNELIKKYSHDEYLKFFGFAPYQELPYKKERRSLLERLGLSSKLFSYFFELHERQQWESILYSGKWEKTFILFQKVALNIVGNKLFELFTFDSLAKQKTFVEKKFPKIRWKFLLFLIGNKTVFNTLLYRGSFVKKNIQESYLEYYQNAFHRLMTTRLAKESFFLQLCFLGKIVHKEGNTVEASTDIFYKIKKNLTEKKTTISTHQNDIVSLCQTLENIDFISFSNVPSYFEGVLEATYLSKMKVGLKPGAIVVERFYLRVPETDLEGFEDITHQYQTLIARETVQMYKFRILKFVP